MIKYRPGLAILRPLYTNFTASKYVLIKDWRLGAMLRTLQLGILIYVLIDVFQKAAYLTTEVPSGVVTAWTTGHNAGGRRKEFQLQKQAIESGNLTYCSDPKKYDFTWGEMQHRKFECAFLDSSRTFENGESQVFLTTSLRVEKLHTYTTKGNGECADPAEIIDSDKEDLTRIETLDNVCSYISDEAYFPILPEKLTIDLIHSYRTSDLIDKKGTLPRTVIRSYDKKSEEVFEAGSQLNLTFARLLELAGVDLDTRLNEQTQLPSKDPSQGNEVDGVVEYPYARVSGLTLQMSFAYYTRKLAPSGYEKTSGDNSEGIVCIVDIIPQNKWTSLGSDIRQIMQTPEDPFFLTMEGAGNVKPSDTGEPVLIHSQTDFQRNGIALVFSFSGNVGRFDIGALIDALVAGSVLLAVAQLITTYFALYAYGVSSQLYKAFMKETVDWRQEYARYAAQACVAGYAFIQYDDNKSYKLDRKEIFNVLKHLMRKNKKMKEWHLAALSDFLMRQGDRGTSNKGRFNISETKESFIDMEEWIDIFTEDKVNWPALTQVLEHEYKDQQSRDDVLELVHTFDQRQREMNQRIIDREMTSSLLGRDSIDEALLVERDGTPLGTTNSQGLDAVVPISEESELTPPSRGGRRSPFNFMGRRNRSST